MYCVDSFSIQTRHRCNSQIQFHCSIFSLVGKMIPENKCFTYTFLGFAGVFCAVAVVLWIVVGGVTPSPSNGSK